jgi:hypothetical protein
MKKCYITKKERKKFYNKRVIKTRRRRRRRRERGLDHAVYLYNVIDNTALYLAVFCWDLLLCNRMTI